MKILVAMSGGVDSSVAAGLLASDGHEVVGATMKLWGGPSDSGCCSVADVDDARRVAQQLGVPHHVFNFSEDFDERVVRHYVAAHAAGGTPNPCVECNRHVKFDRMLDRALALGFDALATGHHARIVGVPGDWSLRRGADPAKDQSYVLYMLGQEQLARVLLPIGSMTKERVRAIAMEMGLRTAAKPDSQDVCFISRTGGREAFLGDRIPFRTARVFQGAEHVGDVTAAELVTVGQRRGFGGPSGERRYVVSVDLEAQRIDLGTLEDLMVDTILLTDLTWVAGEPGGKENLTVQTSAHGAPVAARWEPGQSAVLTSAPIRKVAPGQSVVLYREDRVVGGGIVAAGVTPRG